MDKKGVGLLAFLFTWQGLLIVGAIAGLLFITNTLPLAITQQINFAGLTWNVDQVLDGNGANSATIDSNGFLILNSNAYANYGRSSVSVSTDITTKDEIIAIYEGNLRIDVRHGFSTSADFGITNFISHEYGSSEGGTYERTISPTIVKLINNFDGTHTLWRGIGIGDVYIKEKTISTPIPTILTFSASANTKDGQSRSSMRIYNVMVKKDEAILCKVDEVLINNACTNLTSILLANEAAVTESLNEKISRIEARLISKETSLNSSIVSIEDQLIKLREMVEMASLDPQVSTQEITALNNQLITLNEEIARLKAELVGTNEVLGSIRENDKEVITIIDTGTKEELDQLLQDRCNTLACKFWRWVKSLFGQ